MALIKFKKGDNLQLSKHFNSKEFECPCTACVDQFIDDQLISKLEETREDYDNSVNVTSGYRCPAHNEAVGGVSNSAHQGGLAADVQPTLINVDELDELYSVCYKKFDNVGDGRRLKFIHVDVRPLKADGTKRTWSY